MADFGSLVVAEARSWVGTSFCWGASVKGVACDCKGLVIGVARELGRPEGVAAKATFSGYGANPKEKMLRDGLASLYDRVDEMQPGDVLLLKVGAPAAALHLAIYAGEGRMIHTYSRGPKQVVEVPMGRFWGSALDSIWRWRQ